VGIGCVIDVGSLAESLAVLTSPPPATLTRVYLQLRGVTPRALQRGAKAAQTLSGQVL
jgi:hypothetical protein